MTQQEFRPWEPAYFEFFKNFTVVLFFFENVKKTGSVFPPQLRRTNFFLYFLKFLTKKLVTG